MKNKINNRIKEAMKSKDTLLLNTLRSINSKITEFEKSASGIKVASDNDIINIIEKLAKQREESIKFSIQGNRQDLVTSEQAELDILKEYLPTKLSESEVREIIKFIVSSGTKNIGEIMKAINIKYGNTIDKKLASEIIKEFV